MTVKQLLDSLTFDEIAPYITKRYEGCKDAESVLASFKQHYDYLRHLVPTDQNLIERKEACISYYKDEDGVYLDAYPLEGDLWEDSLSKELVIEEDVKEGNAEIAACCLWHMSFYGYLPYQRRECFDDMFDGTEKKRTQYKAYKTKFCEIIPAKNEIKRIRSFRNEVKRKMKGIRKVHRCHKKHREYDENCMKKRWRHWKRNLIQYELYKRILYCSSFIEDILERGQNIGEIPSLQELGLLYHSNHLAIKRLESTAFNATRRFDYLKELIEDYHALAVARKKMSEHANSFICLSASSEHPVTEAEKALAKILTNGLSGKRQLCIKVDESCGEELRIDIAFYDLDE